MRIRLSATRLTQIIARDDRIQYIIPIGIESGKTREIVLELPVAAYTPQILQLMPANHFGSNPPSSLENNRSDSSGSLELR